jgi:molybdate transport system substrate-binding protein
MIRFWRALLAALVLSSPALAADAGGPQITVLAAASLTNVLGDLGMRYQAASGKHVVFSFAGSMALAKQIEASAGADMFIAADTDSMDYVDQKGLIAKPTRQNLLGNSLVMIAPSDLKISITIAPGMKVGQALGNGRLAVANTMTVPAGKYAKAALTALGVWDQVSDRLAEGEDVRATLAYVARGEAPLGIVYSTDARVEPKVHVVATFPESTHPAIVYPIALTKDAKPDAAAFLAYLKSPEARAAFEKAGFTVLSVK